MRPLLIVGATVVALAGAFGLVRLHQKTIRLEADAEELRHSTKGRAEIGERDSLREQNRRLASLLAQTKRGDAEASSALHAELETARRELAALERRGQQSRADSADPVAPKEDNRDPEKGFARLEYFQNAGRATPVAALQTVVWAALKGDDAALVAGLTVTDAARAKAAEFLAGLPEEVRRKYPTAESLGALVLTGEIVDAAAVQVVGCAFTDSQHAVLDLRVLQAADQALRIPMELGADGWRIVVSDRAIDTLKKRMGEMGAAPSPKN